MTAYGRDRRRRLSVEERQALYARANGLCEDCGAELGADWHGAHMTAWIRGGATQSGTVRAQCPGCNLRFGPLWSRLRGSARDCGST
jgi:hypothetical protein